MKLGVNLPYQGAGDLACAAERLGYDLALAPEGYRCDAASVLGLVAGQTHRIALASGVMQIPARTPALTALTAATLNALSGGRMRIGLGVSNPDVSEGWYGVPFDAPLARTREYVEIVRTALRGRPMTYTGRYFRLPASPDFAGAPLHLLTEPVAADIPIYLGAVGPKNLRLAGEIADGWIGVFTDPQQVRVAVGHLAAGRRRAGRTMDGFGVMPSLPTAVDDDPDRAADLLRPQYSYLLGIGDPERNLYCGVLRELGFEKEVVAIHDRLSRGDRAGAAAAVPFPFIEATALIGPPARIAARMQEYADAGVTTLNIMVSAAATDLAGRLRILQLAMEALRGSTQQW